MLRLFMGWSHRPATQTMIKYRVQFFTQWWRFCLQSYSCLEKLMSYSFEIVPFCRWKQFHLVHFVGRSWREASHVVSTLVHHFSCASDEQCVNANIVQRLSCINKISKMKTRHMHAWENLYTMYRKCIKCIEIHLSTPLIFGWMIMNFLNFGHA